MTYATKVKWIQPHFCTQAERELIETTDPANDEWLELGIVVTKYGEVLAHDRIVAQLVDDQEHEDLLGDAPAGCASCAELHAAIDERDRKIAELEENAVRMSEYRFALEGIPTDGKGNPVKGN